MDVRSNVYADMSPAGQAREYCKVPGFDISMSKLRHGEAKVLSGTLVDNWSGEYTSM